MNYYLYSHSNADGIFYIGKGCGNRAIDKYLSNRSSEWLKASKDGYTSKIEANGTEADILSLERIVIKSLVEKGVSLVNKFHNPNWTFSDKVKQKIRDGVLGKKASDETKQKMSNARFGRKATDETKKRMSVAMSYNKSKYWQHVRLAKANNYRGRL